MSFSSMLTRYSFKNFFATIKIRVRRTWVKGKIFASPAPAFFSLSRFTGLSLPRRHSKPSVSIHGFGDAWAGCNAGYTGIYSLKKLVLQENTENDKRSNSSKTVFFVNLHDKFTAWFCSVCISSSRSTQSPIWAITGRLPWPAKGADSKVFVWYGTKR